MASFMDGVRFFIRPAKQIFNISREAYPVKKASTTLSGLADLIGQHYIHRLEASMKYRDFNQTMADRKKWIGIYTGEDTNSHLKHMFTVGTLEEVILAKSNIVDRGIRRMALTYKESPEYVFAEEATLPDEYRSVNRWVAFKNAERLCNLLGTIAIRPVVRGKSLQWDVLWYFVPLLSGDGGLDLDGIAYPLSAEANPKLWAVWTKDEYYIGSTEDGKKAPFPGREDLTNPYKVVPFTLVHPKQPINNNPFVNGYGMGLVDANDALIVGLTETRIGVRFDMMGQYFTKGLDPKNKIRLGAEKIPNIPDSATFEKMESGGDYEGAIMYLKFEIENTMQNIGLHVIWGEDGGVPSGESLKIKNIELIERREDDVPTWRAGDRAVYENEKIIYDVDLKVSLPELERINFAEMSFPKPASETRDQLEWDWQHGFDTPAAYLMRRDPDGFEDEDAALEFIDENKPQVAVQARSPLNIFGNVSDTIKNGEPA